MTTRAIHLTGANLKYSHIYIKDLLDLISPEALGAHNREDGEGRAVSLQWQGPAVKRFLTDVEGRKRFFRSRTMCRTFFEDTDAKAGDQVEFRMLAPNSFELKLIKSQEASSGVQPPHAQPVVAYQ